MVAFPGMGIVKPTMHPAVRSLGCQQHRIFYQVGSDTILVVRILHKAMDVARHL
jgi:toxin ParE1/3/4